MSTVRTHGLGEIVMPVNAQHSWALEQLLHWDCRLEQAMLRMVLARSDRPCL